MSDPCYVYALVDPRRDNRPFYIGISKDPFNRFYAHLHDPCSAVWDFLHFLTENCSLDREDILCLLHKSPDRRAALDLEYELVMTLPDLMNRPYRRGKSYT